MVFLLSNIVLRAQTAIPPVLPGEVPAPAVYTEIPKENSLVTGVRVSSEFDDNALNEARDKQSNLVTLFEPHIGWAFSSARTDWMLDYRPGFSVGHPLSIYNSQSQLFDTRLRFNLRKHLRLRVRESALETKDVFDQLQQSELAPGSSVVDRPNSSILVSGRESSDQQGADLTYQLSSRTVAGISEGWYRVTYTSAGNAQELGSARSISTHAFSSYHLSQDNWAGLDYSVQALVSQQPHSRALVQSLLYTDTILMTGNMGVSLFAGPQHSVIRNEVNSLHSEATGRNAILPLWNWAGGASFIWSQPHTIVTAGVSRRISDGAGFEGIVRLSSASVELRRQLAKRLQGKLLVSADANSPMISRFYPLSYISLSGGFVHSVNRNLSLGLQYWHSYETNAFTPTTRFLVDHNRFSLSVTYDLKTPLQR